MRSIDDILGEMATEAAEVHAESRRRMAAHLSNVQKGTRVRNVELKQFGRATSPVPFGAETIDVLVPTKMSKKHRGAAVLHSWPVGHVRVARK